MLADLWFYYQVKLIDTINGHGEPPAYVMWLVQRLPTDSLTVALASGGRQYFGWDQKTFILADIYDALNANTRATGNWGKGKAPKIPAYPRPKKSTEDKSRTKPKVTVKQLFKQIAGG